MRRAPILLGFLARRTTLRPPWLNASRVTELSNVSIDSCEAVGFPGANRFALHDSIEDALDTFDSRSDDVRVFAYSVLPVEYDEESECQLVLNGAAGALPASCWLRVGYDVVAGWDLPSIGAWVFPAVL